MRETDFVFQRSSDIGNSTKQTKRSNRKIVNAINDFSRATVHLYVERIAVLPVFMLFIIIITVIIVGLFVAVAVFFGVDGVV